MPGLDTLRAIAVLWTMCFHSFLVGGLGERFDGLQRFGWMGVDLFFVLSGFLVGAQLLVPLARGERPSFGAFYLRRAWRILPAFWAVLLLYLAWPAFREAPGMEPWWKFAGFFVNLSIDYDRNAAFSHAWSLCVEEHFYLMLPLLAVAFARGRSAAALAAFALALLLGGIALRSAVWLHFDALRPAGSWFVERLYYPTWNRLDGLLVGVLLAAARAYRPRGWARIAARADLVFLAGLATMALCFWLFRDRVGLLANSIGWPVLSAGLGMLVFAGAQPGSWLGRRALPGAAWIAAISYSLYLVHKPVYGLVQTHAGPLLEGRGPVAFAAYGLASIGAAALLYYTVERPGLRLGARLRERRSAPIRWPAVRGPRRS